MNCIMFSELWYGLRSNIDFVLNRILELTLLFQKMGSLNQDRTKTNGKYEIVDPAFDMNQNQKKADQLKSR